MRSPGKFALFACVVALVSCGKKEPEPPPTNLQNPDMGAKVDEGPIDDPDEGCVAVEWLGAEPDALIERELRKTTSPVEVSCADGFESDGFWVGKLEFDRDYNVVVTVDGLPNLDDQLVFPPAPVWELREAVCLDGAVQSCSDARTKTFALAANTPYYVVVNGRLDSGGVQVQVALEERVCEPGVTSCEVDELTRCNTSGTEFETTRCAGSCTDDGCAADTCENALVVDLTPNAAPVALAGSRGGYTHTWDSDGLNSCNPYEAGPGGPSLGVELFVSFTGLSAGQTLILDAEASEGNLAFYLLPQCSPDFCTGAFIFDTSNQNRAEIPITEDGPQLVAIEALGDDTRREFHVDASLVE